jgi:hypothetical protein
MLHPHLRITVPVLIIVWNKTYAGWVNVAQASAAATKLELQLGAVRYL